MTGGSEKRNGWLSLEPKSPHVIGGLHCRRVGGQNKSKFAHIFYIKMAVYSPSKKMLLFLSTNVAAVKSHAKHQLKGAVKEN